MLGKDLSKKILFFGHERLPCLVIKKDPYLGDFTLAIVVYFDNVFFIIHITRTTIITALVKESRRGYCLSCHTVDRTVQR